VVEPSLTV